jgi:NAD-dependent dihydropyrimidine dehydrogenase PreA subunit
VQEQKETSECTGRGECVSACYGGDRVITISSTRVEIHERCIGCGLWFPACPEEAISLCIDPSRALMEALMEKISVHTEIGIDTKTTFRNDETKNTSVD